MPGESARRSVIRVTRQTANDLYVLSQGTRRIPEANLTGTGSIGQPPADGLSPLGCNAPHGKTKRLDGLSRGCIGLRRVPTVENMKRVNCFRSHALKNKSPSAEVTPPWRVFFEVVSTVVMLLLAAALVWERAASSGQPRQPQAGPLVAVPDDPITIGTAPVLGNTTAAVAIVEFADFECSACVTFATDTEPALIREYVDTGRVALVFKHYPLQIHPQAKAVAAAAWCAGEQGKFWQAHNRLFRKIKIPDLAGEIGLDVRRYDACIAGPGPAAHVESDRIEGDALQLRATPTFLFGTLLPDGRMKVIDVLIGAHPIDRFKEILVRLLDSSPS